MIPLFTCFPRLRTALPRIALGTLPTPVEPLRISGAADRLFIKRDDLSGTLYGGNKVRKLEFLLAAAKEAGAKRIITSGAAGSNHALATALYGRECGFAVTLLLFRQPPLPGIAATLLADFAAGAGMHFDAHYQRHLEHLRSEAGRCARIDGTAPFIIPPGGSGPAGVVGFVNAAFELKEQIAAGLLPEPAAVYTAFGTMGTAAGLLLGLKAAGIRSRLVAVRVVPEAVAGRDKFRALFDAVNRLLAGADPSFPRCAFDESDFTVSDGYFGGGYGVPTPQAMAAIDEFNSAGISLDPVYTGKTGAAFLADARGGVSRGGPLLFWHTKSRVPPPLPPGGADYTRLPEGFHEYF